MLFNPFEGFTYFKPPALLEVSDLLNPGDEVILFEQYYGYHVNTLLAVEAVPGYVIATPHTLHSPFQQAHPQICLHDL